MPLWSQKKKEKFSDIFMFCYTDEWSQSPVKYSLYTGLESRARRFVYGFKSLLVMVYSRSASCRWIEHINVVIKDSFVLLLNTNLDQFLTYTLIIWTECTEMYKWFFVLFSFLSFLYLLDMCLLGRCWQQSVCVIRENVNKRSVFMRTNVLTMQSCPLCDLSAIDISKR